MFVIKTYDELTFADDYLFCRIMQDEEICKGVIKTLLGVEVEKVEYLNRQQEISPDFDARGIRMDVFVKNSNKVFDLEMQSSNYASLPKRARYYQGLIDIDTLEKSHDYKTLKESFVVFICTKDPFGFGLPCYTVEQVCRQEPAASEKVNDNSHNIYYNAESWHKSENKEVRAFLKFLTTQATDTDLTKSIQSAVYTSRKNELWRKNFMTLYEMIDEVKADGIAIGREEGILEGLERGSFQKAYETARNALKMGLTLEQISSLTGLSIEAIQEIADEINADTDK